MSVNNQSSEVALTGKQEIAIREYKQEMDRLEDEAPRYDVEYHVEADRRRGAVMKAHAMLMDDLNKNPEHVPISTTVSGMGAPEGKLQVMIVVAAEVKKMEFEKAAATYLVDTGDKHFLWCTMDYETDHDLDEWLEGLEYESFEEIEMKFLR